MDRYFAAGECQRLAADCLEQLVFVADPKQRAGLAEAAKEWLQLVDREFDGAAEND